MSPSSFISCVKNSRSPDVRLYLAKTKLWGFHSTSTLPLCAAGQHCHRSCTLRASKSFKLWSPDYHVVRRLRQAIVSFRSLPWLSLYLTVRRDASTELSTSVSSNAGGLQDGCRITLGDTVSRSYRWGDCACVVIIDQVRYSQHEACREVYIGEATQSFLYDGSNRLDQTENTSNSPCIEVCIVDWGWRAKCRTCSLLTVRWHKQWHPVNSHGRS